MITAVVSSRMSSCWAALAGEAVDSYRGEIAGHTCGAHLAKVALVTVVCHAVVEEDGGGVLEESISQNLHPLHVPPVSSSRLGQCLHQGGAGVAGHGQ